MMAAGFNGTNQNLRISFSQITAFPFTFSCVYNPSSFATTEKTVLALCNSGSNIPYYFIGTQTSGKASIAFITSVSSASVNGATTLQASTPYVITGRLQSTSLQLFINGVQDATVNHSVAFSSSINRLSIGSVDRSNPFAYASGSIAEAAVWDAALTDSEIASLGAGYTPDQVCPQSLQFYAPLVRTFQDLRGGLAITNVNGATVATHPRVIT